MNRVHEDEVYMRRALSLASLACGYTSTNPMVGCVIVCDGKIIGEGYHRLCGQAHAEVNAVASVIDKSLLSRSTLYVNLEPCSHYGKTPPCTELILKHKIPRVIIGTIDYFDKVNGRGISILREAGVEVVVGVLEKESRFLNRRFFKYHSAKRPYIILKWAQTCDGYLDNDRDASEPMSWLTGKHCKRVVHKMRAEESAIMVGSNTVMRDNPSLTVREWHGNNPLRVVIDRELRLGNSYNIFDDSAKTVVFNKYKDEGNFIKIDFDKENFLDEILFKLYQLKLTSLIVEGGAKLLNMFITNNLYDEAVVFTSPLSLMELKFGKNGQGVKSPLIPQGEIVQNSVVEGVIVKNIIKK